MQIAIPSYGRSAKCISAKMFSKAVIFCHHFEVKEYEKYNKNDIVGIPDELKGKGMAVIRNYILDKLKDYEILMLDDDIKKVGYYDNCEMKEMNEEEFYYFAENAFRMTRELGTKLWGLNLQTDKKFYREYSPLSFSSVVLAPCFGIIKDEEIRFDEKLGLKEDYDYSIQILKKYRKILRFNKYHYQCGHINLKGGCSNYRTMKKEEDQAMQLRKKWGSAIIKIKRRTQGGNISINPVVISPIRGI